MRVRRGSGVRWQVGKEVVVSRHRQQGRVGRKG